MPNGRGTAALAMTPQIHRPAQCRLFSRTPPAGHTSEARLIGGPMRPQRLRHQRRPAARLKVDQGGRSSDPLLPWFDTAPAAAALPPVRPPPLRQQHYRAAGRRTRVHPRPSAYLEYTPQHQAICRQGDRPSDPLPWAPQPNKPDYGGVNGGAGRATRSRISLASARLPPGLARTRRAKAWCDRQESNLRLSLRRAQ